MSDRFSKLKTQPYDASSSIDYHAVDFSAWRGQGERLIAQVHKLSDPQSVELLSAAVRQVGEARFAEALTHVVTPGWMTKATTDDAAHSFAVEALCLATGRCLTLSDTSYYDLFELLEDRLGCPQFQDGLPFGLPVSHTSVPGTGHADVPFLRKHLHDVETHLGSGALSSVHAKALQYRDTLHDLLLADLGMIYIAWM